MTHYGFIDESETMPKDKIMTVALMILHGKHAADKVHFQLAKSLYVHQTVQLPEVKTIPILKEG
jgi:hypothetical protein